MSFSNFPKTISGHSLGVGMKAGNAECKFLIFVSTCFFVGPVGKEGRGRVAGALKEPGTEGTYNLVGGSSAAQRT